MSYINFLEFKTIAIDRGKIKYSDGIFRIQHIYSSTTNDSAVGINFENALIATLYFEMCTL